MPTLSNANIAQGLTQQRKGHKEQRPLNYS